MDQDKNIYKAKSDMGGKALWEISRQLKKIDSKLFITIIILIGLLIVALADL